jgi:predicted esterase YcpF (UPF0227 family)
MLYYIHGYLSSPESKKGLLLKEKLKVKPIKYRDCQPENLIISDCLKSIYDEIKNDNKVVLIGSSMGGFLAAKTALINKNVNKLILLNPAIIPPKVDIGTIQGIPIRILTDMKDKFLFDCKIEAEIYILLGTKDDVIPYYWSIEFAKSQEAYVKFYHDDHRFFKNINNLPDIISNIINQKN